jgi:hypothetical protein
MILLVSIQGWSFKSQNKGGIISNVRVVLMTQNKDGLISFNTRVVSMQEWSYKSQYKGRLISINIRVDL